MNNYLEHRWFGVHQDVDVVLVGVFGVDDVAWSRWECCRSYDLCGNIDD